MTGFPGRQTRSRRHQTFNEDLVQSAALWVEQSKQPRPRPRAGVPDTREARLERNPRHARFHEGSLWRRRPIMRPRRAWCGAYACWDHIQPARRRIVALAILIVALLRSFSKNRDARYSENAAFRRMMAKLPFVGERFGGAGGGTVGAALRTAALVLPSSLSARLAPPKRCGRSARRRLSSSAPTAGRCSRFPAARGNHRHLP